MSSIVLRQVESLLDKLTSGEQAVLMENLARRMRLTILSPATPPQDLYGIWKDKFPENVDLDAALREMRQEWELEWDEKGTFTE